MTTTITGRVAAGAAFLNVNDPDWWRADVERAIDLDRLDLANADLCVLGQRCPLENADNPYAVQAAYLGSGATDAASLWRWAVKLGFAIGEERDCDLTAEWAKVIRERRSA